MGLHDDCFNVSEPRDICLLLSLYLWSAPVHMRKTPDFGGMRDERKRVRRRTENRVKAMPG